MSSLAARVGCTVKAKMTLPPPPHPPLFPPPALISQEKGGLGRGEDARGARLFGGGGVGGGREGRGKFKNCFPSFLLLLLTFSGVSFLGGGSVGDIFFCEATV